VVDVRHTGAARVGRSRSDSRGRSALRIGKPTQTLRERTGPLDGVDWSSDTPPQFAVDGAAAGADLQDVPAGRDVETIKEREGHRIPESRLPVEPLRRHHHDNVRLMRAPARFWCRDPFRAIKDYRWQQVSPGFGQHSHEGKNSHLAPADSVDQPLDLRTSSMTARRSRSARHASIRYDLPLEPHARKMAAWSEPEMNQAASRKRLLFA
jgi:hypothetical protein